MIRDFWSPEAWQEQMNAEVKVAYRLVELGLVGDPDSIPHEPEEIARIDAEYDEWKAGVERGAAFAATATVEALHRHGWQEEPTGNGMDGEVTYERVAWCLHCDTESPCPTIRALGSVPSTGEGQL